MRAFHQREFARRWQWWRNNCASCKDCAGGCGPLRPGGFIVNWNWPLAWRRKLASSCFGSTRSRPVRNRRRSRWRGLEFAICFVWTAISKPIGPGETKAQRSGPFCAGASRIIKAALCRSGRSNDVEGRDPSLLESLSVDEIKRGAKNDTKNSPQQQPQKKETHVPTPLTVRPAREE